MRENLPLLSAMLGVWNRNLLGYPTTAVIPYSTGLKYFTAHLQQCGMESNGKVFREKGRRLVLGLHPLFGAMWGQTVSILFSKVFIKEQILFP